MPRRDDRRRHSWIILACGLLVLETACSNAEQTPRGPRPDIVLLVVDTLRADHLGSYGYTRRTSPHLDALAADSLRFTRAFSSAPWTTPAVAALLTSRHPSSLGITNVQSPLPRDVVLLPEMLQEAGYRTGAFVSHSFVSEKWGFARGFDTFDESNVKGHLATTSPRLVDLAIRWIDDLEPTDSPFFLLVHFFDPHFVYLEQPGFAFGGVEPSYHGPVHSGALPSRLAEAPGGLDDADLRELERLYDSEIAVTDRAIGRLLDHLRAKGLYDSALVVATADHGEEFLDHGALDHAKTLYDELMNVPLLVKLPGVEPTRVDRSVALVDVLPTIADWLDVEPPAETRGVSLLGRDDTPRPIFLETQRLRRLRGVVLGNLKLIVDLDSGEVELFDLSSDPDERSNLSAGRPEQVRTLRRLVDALGAEGQRDDAETLELSDEERARLKALGYL